MTHVTCRLTAKNRDQLQNPTLGNRVWAIPLPFSLFVTNAPSALFAHAFGACSLCNFRALGPLCLLSALAATSFDCCGFVVEFIVYNTLDKFHVCNNLLCNVL